VLANRQTEAGNYRIHHLTSPSRFRCDVLGVNFIMVAAGAWAVVNTQPNRERIALENLVRQAFDAYCPFVRRRVKHARRVDDVLRPLFTSYLFVHFNPQTQHWRPILSTFGVRKLVRFGEQLGFVPDDFVEELRSHEIDGEIVHPARSYAVGQRVHVTNAAFSGLVGTIIEMNDKNRLVVLMNLLNRPVKVQVPTRMVVPA
jgi:transcriptional antiterminator RfaH